MKIRWLLAVLTITLTTPSIGFAGERVHIEVPLHQAFFQAPLSSQLSNRTDWFADDENKEQKGEEPSLRVGSIAGQFLAGMGGQVVGAIGGAALGSLFPQPSGDDEAGLRFFGFILGGTLGSSIGVYWVGTNTHGGSYWATLGGNILFTSIYILYEGLVGIPENSALEVTGHLILPVTGAVIGFNLTRRCTSPSAGGNALIHFRDGQMRLAVPTLSFRLESYDRGILTQRVDLAKVRF